MARAANTGVSCFINHLGEIPRDGGFEARVQDIETGSSFVTGTLPSTVSLLKNPPLTFYARFGDLFSKSLLGIAVAWLIFRCLRPKKEPADSGL
jgi:apolipoprotein N-acyltransferase